MKYLKNAYKLINSYPIIMLFYSPLIILSVFYTILSKDASSGSNLLILSIYSLLISIFSLFAILLISKTAFIVRDDIGTDYEVNIMKTLSFGIPKTLLYVLIIFVAVFIVGIIIFIMLIPNIIGIAIFSNIPADITIIGIILYGIGILVKGIIYILFVFFTGMYSTVFMIFLNTNLSVVDMVKSSFMYTLANFKKLFFMLLLALVIPQIIIYGSMMLYNLIIGLSLTNTYFLSTWMYALLQIIIWLGALLFIIGVVLTWNDEEDKSRYLNPAS